MESELNAKQLPHSLEAEQAVLGSILIDSRCLTDVIGIVNAEDFYLEQNRQIYQTIYTMFNFSQTIDPVTVLDKMKELGVHRDDSRNYILQLMEITPTSANVMEYAKIVSEKSLLRALTDAGTTIADMARLEIAEPQAVLDEAERRVFAVRNGRSASEMTPSQSIPKA